MGKRRKVFRRVGWTLLIIFLLLNVTAFFHAWKFTHFSNVAGEKTKAGRLSFAGRAKALAFGIDNPRPEHKRKPARPYETVILQSNKKIECWYIRSAGEKGTVILFHGYGGEKSSMLAKAEEFLAQGYSAFLVDFMGSGGSEGNQTTIGYKESEQVKSCFDHVSGEGGKPVFLFGTSLGAAAILKAVHDYDIQPSGIIIECPFGSLYKTTCARFQSLGLPSFPMAGLLVFWGGVQNGFWPFSFRPEEYSKSVRCPALLIYGEKDDRVSRGETDIIFKNLKGRKTLKLFPRAGHEDFMLQYQQEWIDAVRTFLANHQSI